MTQPVSQPSRAFDLGCNARLAGLSFTSCTYPKNGKVGVERMHWRQGWMHVDTEWGAGVNGRWAFTALPARYGETTMT